MSEEALNDAPAGFYDSPARLSAAALESLREGLIAVDGRGTIRLCNAAAADLFGLPVERVVGQMFASVFIELPHADALTDLVFQAIQAGALHDNHEIDLETAAGPRRLHVTTSFLEDAGADGSARGVVIALHDVTELRRLSGALAQTNRQLQDSYRDVEEKNQRLTDALKRVQVMRVGATVVVLALVAGLGWYSIRAGPASAAGGGAAGLVAPLADGAAPGRTVTVDAGTIRRSIRLSGTLDPSNQVTIVAPIGGRVIQRPVRVGETVQRGQLLMELRDDTLATRIRAAEIAASRARTKVDDLRNWATGPEVQESRRSLTLATMAVEEQKKARDEAQRLFARDIIPEQELNTARASLERAEISAQSSQQAYDQVQRRASRPAVAEAEAELQNAEDDLARLRAEQGRQQITAPVPGLVITPPAGSGENAGVVPSPGDAVSSGSPVLAIADISGFAVVLRVDELEVKRIHAGQPATVTIDALDEGALGGEVASVAGQALANAGVPTFEVRVAVHQVPDAVRAAARLGMTATVEIITALRERVVVLPIEAVSGVPGNQTVQVLDADGKTRTARPVTTGLADQHQVEITSGVTKGEVVVY